MSDSVESAPVTPRQQLAPAPRTYPSGLSGRLVKAFAKPAGIGIVVGLIAMGIGLWLEDDYRQWQEMRYYGEYIQAVAGNAMSDEDGEWASVAYVYNGQEYTAHEIDITEETYSKIASSAEGYALLPVVIWPEEPNDPVSVDWIDAKGGFFEFAWAYWLGLVVLAIGMLFAIRNALRMRRVYTRGQEVWATPVSGVNMDEHGNMSAMVDYEIPGVISTAAPVMWRRPDEPVIREDLMMVLVDPKRPDKARVVTERDLRDILNG